MKGSNKYWQGFLFSNSRYRPYWVKLNGQDLEMSNENFWVHDAEATAPYNFQMMSWGGNVISFQVDDILAAQDTGIQFPGYFADARNSRSNVSKR